MLKSIRLIAVVFGLSMLATGCTNIATAKVDPNIQLVSLKTMYVQHYPSDNTKVNEEIAAKLRTKGAIVTTGDGPIPDNIDALVYYEDHWHWDITMYMLQLKVLIKDPKTMKVLAVGDSVHTSLTRKSQTEMVTEVIDDIYANQPIATKK
jgi:hypothetical protein